MRHKKLKKRFNKRKLKSYYLRKRRNREYKFLILSRIIRETTRIKPPILMLLGFNKVRHYHNYQIYKKAA